MYQTESYADEEILLGKYLNAGLYIFAEKILEERENIVFINEQGL